ncbi:hypothetical protein XENOCAPTIV_030299 [Xenoophorus captivus]|uniref:SPRY domain-containing protein n=1 Tax=Xenoophorus captivus TaxID=1517983 RepID=A0ABV0R2C1_9TELE
MRNLNMVNDLSHSYMNLSYTLPCRLYNGSTVGQQFGAKCCRGDKIGCGISFDSDDGQITVFFTKNGEEVRVLLFTESTGRSYKPYKVSLNMSCLPMLPQIGSVEIPASPDDLYPAVGMHSLGEEVVLDLNAEWRVEDDDGQMIVDSHEEDWSRLHDVKVTGTLLEYTGKGKSIVDVGLAQACRPLNPRFHYYELEITDAGEKCYIALGLARKDYPKDKHPGWNKGSIAYHAGGLKVLTASLLIADDGKLFHGSGVGDPFGPRCFEGDIMGCGIMFPRDFNIDGGGEHPHILSHIFHNLPTLTYSS